MQYENEHAPAVIKAPYLYVTQHSVLVALASYLANCEGKRAGIDDFLSSYHVVLPLYDTRLQLWKNFLQLSGVGRTRLAGDLALDIDSGVVKACHAVLRFGRERESIAIDRHALFSFLATFEAVVGLESLPANFGLPNNPTHGNSGELTLADYRLNDFDGTPISRLVNALIIWAANAGVPDPLDAGSVRRFAVEYANIKENTARMLLRDADVHDILEEYQRAQTLDRRSESGPTEVAESIKLELRNVGRFHQWYRQLQYASPEETFRLLLT